MTAPLYEVIHSLALKIVDASARNDENSGAEAYAVLKELCESNEGTKLDLNRPQFARHLLAIENGTKRGVYEQAALSRRVQD